MKLIVRKMKQSDCHDFYIAFQEQNWNKPIEMFEKYYLEQEEGKRRVFVAELDGQVTGYTTLLMNDPYGPFANTNIPVVNDFNVLIKYQRNGIGNAILDVVEETAEEFSDKICLGVGLHNGYGTAQRMYVKRGYIPDGSGVWYKNANLEQYADCNNDDDLVLYMSKSLV